MFSHHGSFTVEFGTGETFGNKFQDGNNIHKESTRNQELGTSPERFFRNLNIGVVIRLNVDTVRHRYWGRTNKTGNTNKRKWLAILAVPRNITGGRTSGYAARNRWASVKADRGSAWHILLHAVDWYYDSKDWSVLWTFGDSHARHPHKEEKQRQSPIQIYNHISYILSIKYDTKHLQFVEHGKVWSNWSKEEIRWIAPEKGPIIYLPTGVGNG